MKSSKGNGTSKSKSSLNKILNTDVSENAKLYQTFPTPEALLSLK